MTVEWIKCKGDTWCDLFKLDMNHSLLDINGVFVIFGGNGVDDIIYIGCGNIKSELNKLVKDPAIVAFKSHGCFVTWAHTNKLTQSGIANYLINNLKPKLNPKASKSLNVTVNLPWS